ncbi:MAG TPA: hypothetical protein VG187_15835 [Mycobacterium sp.]|nr:hypothetical protein [Mycobacterium sp.]
MSTIWTLLRATAVVAGSSAALLMGGLMGTAHADPAAPPIPAPNIGEQLVTSAANAPQLLQNLATAIGAQPPAPPPLASAAIKVPQPSAAGLPGAASAVPGATSLVPGLPGTAPAATTATPGLGIPGLTPTLPAPAAPASGIAGIPGLTPTVPAAAPTTGPAGLLPQAQLNLPQMPFLGVPLPQQVSLPGDLTSLLNGGVPASPGISPPGLVPVPASAPVTSPNPLYFPVSGLP